MNISDFVVGGLGAILLWCSYLAFTFVLRSVFAQKVYSLRDEMFMDAADGRLSFNDGAYGVLRTMMHASLFGSKEIDCIQLIAAMLFMPGPRGGVPTLEAEFQDALTRISDPDRVALYCEYRERLLKATVIHLFISFAFPIACVIAWLYFWAFMHRRGKRVAQPELAAQAAHESVELTPHPTRTRTAKRVIGERTAVGVVQAAHECEESAVFSAKDMALT